MAVIECKNISFDFEKACFDLAMTYAKSRLDHAISSGHFSNQEPIDDIAQMNYLFEDFCSSLGYFSSHNEDFIKSLVDRA